MKYGHIIISFHDYETLRETRRHWCSRLMPPHCRKWVCRDDIYDWHYWCQRPEISFSLIISWTGTFFWLLISFFFSFYEDANTIIDYFRCETLIDAPHYWHWCSRRHVMWCRREKIRCQKCTFEETFSFSRRCISFSFWGKYYCFIFRETFSSMYWHFADIFWCFDYYRLRFT